MAQIKSLAWELPYIIGVPIKEKKKKKEEEHQCAKEKLKHKWIVIKVIIRVQHTEYFIMQRELQEVSGGAVKINNGN